MAKRRIGRPVEPFELTAEEKQTLERWSRGRTVSQALAVHPDRPDSASSVPIRSSWIDRGRQPSLARGGCFPGLRRLEREGQDRLDAGSLAPHGFGAEVARAQARRREVLRQVGINPDDPNRSAKLAEIERRAVGRKMAARLGLVFVAEAPSGFRGRVDLVKATATDALYVAVSDGSRCVLLRASPALQAMEGKFIELTRDRRGELQVRVVPERDLGR